MRRLSDYNNEGAIAENKCLHYRSTGGSALRARDEFSSSSLSKGAKNNKITRSE